MATKDLTQVNVWLKAEAVEELRRLAAAAGVPLRVVVERWLLDARADRLARLHRLQGEADRATVQVVTGPNDTRCPKHKPRPCTWRCPYRVPA